MPVVNCSQTSCINCANIILNNRSALNCSCWNPQMLHFHPTLVYNVSSCACTNVTNPITKVSTLSCNCSICAERPMNGSSNSSQGGMNGTTNTTACNNCSCSRNGNSSNLACNCSAPNSNLTTRNVTYSNQSCSCTGSNANLSCRCCGTAVPPTNNNQS
jgi:hypothetical protein